jgi:hypothetical protein
MKYIGNYANWLKPEWLREVSEKSGFDMPRHSMRNEARFNPILKKYFEDVTRIITQEEYDQLMHDLDQLDQNDQTVKHAKKHVSYLDPARQLDDEYNMYKNAGYEVYGDYFKLLEKFDLSFDILENPPPFLDTTNKHITWWISKMLPGMRMPMHVDRADPEISVHKYWMPWTPYEKGHVFMYEDIIITEYELGDVWVFENPAAWHGAVNIGHTERTILQITDYKPSRDLTKA